MDGAHEGLQIDHAETEQPESPFPRSPLRGEAVDHRDFLLQGEIMIEFDLLSVESDLNVLAGFLDRVEAIVGRPPMPGALEDKIEAFGVGKELGRFDHKILLLDVDGLQRSQGSGELEALFVDRSTRDDHFRARRLEDLLSNNTDGARSPRLGRYPRLSPWLSR